MADYFPPSENLPIFDVSVFRSTNDNVITQDEADRLYLSRLGTASSLATSTSFQGSITTTGNLTLNAPLASNRIIEGSYLRLVDNASISTNKPLIWYPDPSLQITTNDVVGAVKTIDLKSFNGAGTGVSTSLTCQYGQVQAQGILKLTQNTNTSNFSTITQDATNVTISTADIVGPTRAIILKTFDGLGTNQSAAVSVSYGQLFANGVIKLANLTNSARFSTITMGSTELTISNDFTGASPHLNLNTAAAGAGNVITNSPFQITNKADPTKASTITQGALNLTVQNSVAAGNILLNTNAGAIVANTPFVPADAPAALFAGRPSLGYVRYGSGTAIAITSTAPVIYTTTTDTPVGVWLFEANVTCVKSTSTFSTVAPLSSTRLSYVTNAGLVWNGLNNSFENPLFDLYTTINYCGCEGGSRVVTITAAQAIQFQFQANWATIAGSPTYSIYWSAVRIA